jgi:hypothetical protein
MIRAIISATPPRAALQDAVSLPSALLESCPALESRHMGKDRPWETTDADIDETLRNGLGLSCIVCEHLIGGIKRSLANPT